MDMDSVAQTVKRPLFPPANKDLKKDLNELYMDPDDEDSMSVDDVDDIGMIISF